MKRFWGVLIVLAFCSSVEARMIDVLLYCDFRAPQGTEIKEHWKPEIPNVGVDEVVRNFYIVASQGSKRLFHCLIETDNISPKQMERIKAYIDTFNEGKSIQQRILYWKGSTALEAYKALWQDRGTDPFIETIAKKILQYPVRKFTQNEEDPIKASIEDAENLYGLTIQNSVLNTCGDRCIPHKFLGR